MDKEAEFASQRVTRDTVTESQFESAKKVTNISKKHKKSRKSKN